MLLLALDTATPAITVAVHDGSAVVGRADETGATAHGELLGPAIQRALQEAGAAPADLTDIAAGVGPGPFTGLRVGIVTARTLAATLGITAHGVCTLDVVAAEVPRGEPFLVAIDARRREVYWAHYGADGTRVDGPHVATPADVAAQHPKVPAYGRGAQMYAELLAHRPGPLDPSAAALAELVASGRATDLALEPLYLRRPDVTLT